MCIRSLSNFESSFFYGYDDTGLKTSMQVDDSRFEPLIPTGDEEDFTPGVLNQYTVAKEESLSYDGNGNLANDGTNTYVYDAENRLISASNTVSSSYTYDSFGRRSLKTVDGTSTTFIYDGDQVIAEYNGSGALVRKFVFGPGIDEPVILEDVAARYNYHADSLGSVIALSNDSGAYTETYAYSSWGQVVTVSSVGNPYLYTGRRLDPETGIYYYRNRYYDANLRRFLQADPIGFAGGMNLYAYVGNSPWNYVDPLGLTFQDAYDVWNSFIKNPENRVKYGIPHQKSMFNKELVYDYPFISFFQDTLAFLDKEGVNVKCIDNKTLGALYQEEVEFRRQWVAAAASVLIGGGIGRPTSTRLLKQLRVRHYTSPRFGKSIMQGEVINPGRGNPIGVHVEVAPFGPARNGSAETGAFESGAYIEFDAPANLIPTNVGPRNTGVIPTEKPLPIGNLNPVLKKY